MYKMTKGFILFLKKIATTKIFFRKEYKSMTIITRKSHDIKTKIKAAELGNAAGIIGAALLGTTL